MVEFKGFPIVKITRFQRIIEDKNHTFSKDSIDEERKTRTPAPVFFSSDGAKWIEAKQGGASKDVYEYPIPSELVDAADFWVRYDGWGLGADECHAGYAFLR